MNWLKNFYEKLAFQKRYDEIKAWKLPKEIDEVFDYVWASVPSAIQASVFRMIKDAYEEYGKEYATKLLEEVLKWLKSVVAVRSDK